MAVTVICGDVRDLPVRGPFHAILCDPPYELGFMGKSWDASGVAHDVEMWRNLLALLHPGGFGMAFGGSRTYHRLACAIEDAGAVLHPMIGWAYGSGFPKATRIDTQVDRAAGAERKVVGKIANPSANVNATVALGGSFQVAPDVTVPATPLAAAWGGHRYGLQALKPVLEPICCFQRPYEGKPWQCITETGAGALNIEGARVGTENVVSNRWDDGMLPFGGSAGHTYTPHIAKGRWPANLILGHSPDCDGTCAGGCAIKALNTTIGKTADAKYHDRAHFFTQVDWQLEQAEPLYYQAKASRRERDAGLEEICGSNQVAYGKFNGTPYHGTNQTGTPRHNPHPTVKPIALARHLATLLLPPPEYAPRRILIPFAGTGSEMIGAMLAGWEEVVGIEMDPEYCDMARARIAHWMRQPALIGEA